MKAINKISKAFNQQAADYERAARVQYEIGTRLAQRLQYIKIQPQRILDLGCGPGTSLRVLKTLFPKAQILGFDLAHAMLVQAQSKQTWRRRFALTAGDMHQMPFPDGVFDLVFANQVVHWGSPLPQLFREVYRVMNVHGCLMFSTLGPDTFKELNQVWGQVDRFAHVNQFADMHDVGDWLLQARFLDPVMDMELLAAHYPNISALIHSLKTQGVKNINPARNPGLTGKNAWADFQQKYDTVRTAQGKYPLTYEVVYGQAWKGSQHHTKEGQVTAIPVAQIRK